jgi:hypothetical protein
MTSAISGAVAFLVGTGLAVASVVGVVQMRSTASGPASPEVESQVVDYGTNDE